MKTIYFSLLLVLLSFQTRASIFSQVVRDSFILDLEQEKSNRSISNDFHSTMLHLAEPSTVSTGITPDRYIRNGVEQKRPFIINLDSKFPIALMGKNWYSRRSGLFFTFHAIPQYQARIFRDDPMQGDSSRSVRTPSYIPGGNLFITHKKWWGKDLNLKKIGPVKQHLFAMFRGFHHSNGQDQKEFKADGTINTYNGNFGEGIVFEMALGAYYSKTGGKIDSLKRRRILFHPRKFQYTTQQQYNAYWKLGYEHHPKITERITTNLALDQYDLLGRNLIRFQAGFINCPKTKEYAFQQDGTKVLIDSYEAKERWRLVSNASYISDRKLNSGPITDLKPVGLGNLGKRVNLDLTFYKKAYGSKHAAWFAQVGYYGSDPYNMYFQQSVLFYRIGLAWSPFKLAF